MLALVQPPAVPMWSKEGVLACSKGKPLNEFTAKNRFRFYDLLFLDVLSKYNSKGSELFERMFAKNDPLRIFRFLDEKTALWEDLLILASFSFQQKKWFIYALFRRFF